MQPMRNILLTGATGYIGRCLFLQAQMKSPGRAWLEFLLTDRELVQTAYCYPNGLCGRSYWHLVLPFHNLVFRKLGRNIIREARRIEAADSHSWGQER